MSGAGTIAAWAQPAGSGSGGTDEGKRLYRADCAGCHKWHGDGGGGYGGAAASLRKTTLDRDLIILTVGCGRPGTGMPYHLRDAYTAEHPCYGMSNLSALGKNAPIAADNPLRPPEIAAIVGYVMADIKGRGEPTYPECQAFFGSGSRVCNVYQKKPGGSGLIGSGPQAGPGETTKP